jgi:hypothetical protein
MFPRTDEEIKIFAHNQGMLRKICEEERAIKNRIRLDKCREYAFNKRRERGVKIRFSRNTLSQF